MADETPIPALLNGIKKNYVHYLEDNFKIDDINVAQFPILMVLKNHDGVTQKELAVYLSYSEGLITRFIKKLEENKYLERKTNEKNKREKIITITPKGLKLANEVIDCKDRWEKEVFEFLNEEEFLKFKKTIDVAIENSRELIKS